MLYINLCISFVFQAQVTDLTKFLFSIGLQICYDRRSIVQSVRKRSDLGVCGRYLSLVFGPHCLAKWCHKLSSSCKYTSSVQRANLFLSSLLYSKLFNFFRLLNALTKKKNPNSNKNQLQISKLAASLRVVFVFSFHFHLSFCVFFTLILTVIFVQVLLH